MSVKTDDLINFISQGARRPANLSLTMLDAVSSGAALVAALFFATLGFRHDITQAAETIRFAFKFLVTLSLFSATSSLLPMIRPSNSEVAWG